MVQECEIPQNNASDKEVLEILSEARIIAVVGLSDKPDRDSYRVAAYLQKKGYRIIPVNPNADTILGEQAWPSLIDAPHEIDVVDIFRKPEAVPEIVDAAIKKGVGAIWMQEGIAHNASAKKARKVGLKVVMNKCMMKEHKSIEKNRKLV